MSITCASEDLEPVALFRHFPRLRTRVPWVVVGDWPTPVEPLAGYSDVFVKREDISSQIYGGNKVRTLEAHLGRAVSHGARRIWATGAFGSNHSVATVLHASSAGLASGIALFPQPPTDAARENLLATLSVEPQIAATPNVVLLPFVMAKLELDTRRDKSLDYVMSPGGATPVGAIGHVSAALEVADQVHAGILPAPRRIVVPVGSACTTAGLLLGLAIAQRLDLLPPVSVTSVRVTPWPVTSRSRIAHLAYRTGVELTRLIGPIAAIGFLELRSALKVERRFFGGGYGRPTKSGRRAIELMDATGGPPLDVVYSAKSGAALFELIRERKELPLLFWATKSSVPLPSATPAQLDLATGQMKRWLDLPPL